MIHELRIRGLGVIDDAVLELHSGLTVLTGETGAGKTMVVTGLGLLLGGRADASSVRTGSDRALVEGRIRVPPGSAAAERVHELGADLDEDELIVARAVSAEGRSRAWLGGRSVPVGTLADLAGELVAVHGQSDQQRLLQPARQRAALDRFAGDDVLKLLEPYRAGYVRLRALEAELTEVVERARERSQEADLLRFGLAEVAAVAPQAGEERVLDAEAERLSHADGLREAAGRAHAALMGEPDSTDGADALALVVAARRSLEQVREHDAALAALADRIAEVATLVADAGADLASYASSVDTDPLRLQAVQERRAALRTLTRKYGPELDDVLGWAAVAGGRLSELDGDDDRAGRLRSERVALRTELADLAAALSQGRRAAADRFAPAVSAELADLAMPQAQLTVDLRQSEDAGGLPAGPDGRTVTFGPHGVDEVELALSPHPGGPVRPLARGASGGELSRVMLAVEVVFAGADPVPTLVFDEVDAGVGGRAAVEVGLRLARLARIAQVVVVTHLPQVAAFADRHLVVEKSSDGAVTRSGVTSLDGPGRVRELTRMLAGLEGSASGQAHAEELLAAAASAKQF